MPSQRPALISFRLLSCRVGHWAWPAVIFVRSNADVHRFRALEDRDTSRLSTAHHEFPASQQRKALDAELGELARILETILGEARVPAKTPVQIELRLAVPREPHFRCSRLVLVHLASQLDCTQQLAA
eukprot:scaffold666_cov332-Prasinococcus_capsulatus_cf.AAC.23